MRTDREPADRDAADPEAADRGLDPHRIAEVIATSAAGRGRRGSGYRVGDTAVLTAWHVVAEAAEVRVRFDADRAGQWAAQAAVSWADPGTDLAVLSFTPPGAQSVPPARFGRIPDDRHAVVAVHAAGFPLWKQRRRADGRAFRELHQADGTVAALSNLRTGTLELTVPAAAADPDPAVSPWSGMSGAAVWAGSRIVGVVAEHHRGEGMGRLTAARIDHALRRVDEPQRRELVRLLAIPDPEALPRSAAESANAEPEPPEPAGFRVIGLPVAHGLELFKDRTEARETIGRCLADPAIRVVTVTGRRGMGKSAVAAKVMEGLANGEWPGRVSAPLPSALVNLSTRTTGVSLERVYFDCARVLGPDRERRLQEVWSSNRPVPEKVGELFSAMGDELVVILMDNLEDRLQDDGRLDDEDLAVFFDCLFRTRATPRLLVTSQVPLRLAPELRRFAVEVELSDGLPAGDSVALLRELDRDGSLGVGQLSDAELLRASVHVHGVPRALELLVGAMADDMLTLPTLREILEDFTLRGDVVAGLAEDRYHRLGPEGRTVLNVLAVLRTPVPRQAIEWIVAGLAPELDLAVVLAELLRVHMLSVDRASRTFALHPMDADLAYGAMPLDGPLGRRSVERRAADWYAGIAPPRETWRTLDDIQPYRREFEHRTRAGEPDQAALVLGKISEWMIWRGGVAAVISMHLTLEGQLTDDRARLAHLIGFGHARLSAGPMADAVALFTQAADLAERHGERGSLRDALFGLGDAHRQLGSLDAAAKPLARAAQLAQETGDTDGEAHALLSLSLTHSYLGEGTAALAGADRLRGLARGSGDRLTEARSWNARAIALLVLGRWEDVLPAGDEAIRGYRDAGVSEAVNYAFNAQGIALLALGRRAEAVTALEAALDESLQMENPRAVGVSLFDLAWAYWTEERYDRAADAADRAAASLRLAGATEAAAAEALAEAARAVPASQPAAAADALTRAADGIVGNVELVRPAWFLAEAERLRGQDLGRSGGAS
ncbi:trypsin-like peptidase domain-containing protein [Kitasatospora sp. NPDC093679]|uniref:trypsin-like peptidase domain-containing protein n=1 Tax=Kitasatospora sp. NPDC093679 TaxID=3154983 RepID=UPI003432328D